MDNEYCELSEFWEPSPSHAKIIQPWKDSKYYCSVSPPVVMYTLIQFLKQTLKIPGDVAEFGTFKGGSANLIAQELINKRKKLHLFDTFCGMPSVSIKDNHWKQGMFGNTSIEAVKEKFSIYDFVEIHQGLFKETKNKLIMKLSVSHM
jgi:hypothetical protein